jgi:hypothetical protein
MKRWGKQYPIRFDESELKTDLGSSNFIFVGSSCDMFADNIPEEWIINTISYCEGFNNNYLFQSKNPSRMSYYILRACFPYNSVVCTTIESNKFYPDIMGVTPTPYYRAMYMSRISKIYPTYVTIEPIMDFDLKELVELIKICHPVQVNIGADSGNNHLPEPPKEKILELIDELKKFTVIDQKRNLNRILNT